MSNEIFAVDRLASERRATALEKYLAQHVWNPTTDRFVCISGSICRQSAQRKPGTAFYEAQGHMVGPCFDLFINDEPFRVLVVPIEAGGSRKVQHREHVTVAQRTGYLLEAKDKPFWRRNAHMRGVTFALQLAFGLYPKDEDDEGKERLTFADGSTAHFFEAYAMTNLLLCSAVVEGTMRSRSTGIMRGSCARHMRATIDILQPTLVISQGDVLDETLRAIMGVTKPVSVNIAHCELGGNEFVWASLKHPTWFWRMPLDEYLWDVVVPTIQDARALALHL